MRRFIRGLFGAVAALTLSAQAGVADQLDSYLLALEGERVSSQTEKDAISFIDDLQDVSPTERRASVRRLQELWMRDALTAETQRSLDRVLCRIAPFRVADDFDRKFQERMHARFQQLWNAYREAPSEQVYEAARMADCASYNTAGGYFDLSRAASPVMPFGSCEFADYLPPRRLDALIGELRPVLDRGGLKSGSFYAIRAEQLFSVLNVAKALAEFRDGQIGFEEVKTRLRAVSARLRSLPVDPVNRVGAEDSIEPGSIDDLLSLAAGNRNGWRFGNDLAFHAAVHGLVGARDDAEAEPHIAWLEQIAALPPVLDQATIAPAVEPWIATQIREVPNYRDPIRLDRVFPGLVRNPRADCQRNRRQSLEVTDLAKGTLTCWQRLGGGVASHQDMLLFDACLTEIQSPVWWLQVGAYRDNRRANAALDRLGEDLPGFSELEFEVIPPDAKSAFYRLRTTRPLTRSEVGDLADRAKLAGYSQLIGRNPIF